MKNSDEKNILLSAEISLPQTETISLKSIFERAMEAKPVIRSESTLSTAEYLPNLKLRALKANLFKGALVVTVLLVVSLLVFLLSEIFVDGVSWLSWDFLNNLPSRMPARAGIAAAILGSFWLVALTALVAVPVGVGTAVFLEEYSKKTKLGTFIEINISNLAGVPSIIYGLLGLVVFVRTIGLGRSLFAGALTMGLLVLPVIIVASREALKSVPDSIRQAAYALGATQWQAIRSHILPAATPGIMTGIILSLSRAIGETAPLIMVGAATYISFLPDGPLSEFTALPIQIFDWTSRPQQDFHELAAAGIIVLLTLLLSMNATAIFIRNHYQRKLRW